MRTIRIIMWGVSALLGFSFSAFAEEQSTKPLLHYTVGVNGNWLYDDGYFDFKASTPANYDEFKFGYDLAVQYHLGSHFDGQPNLNPLSISLGWSGFADYQASRDRACSGGRTCRDTTSLDHDALMLNIHYIVVYNSSLEIDVYGGSSYVFAEGKINDDSWKDNAIGLQLGAKLFFLPHKPVNPFLGLRWHGFNIKQDGEEATIGDLSILAGLRF